MNGFNGLRQAQAERNLLYRAISKALLVRQRLYAFTSADDAVAALPFLLSNHAAHLNGEMNMNYKRRLSEVLTAASRDVSVQPRHFQGDIRNNRQRQDKYPNHKKSVSAVVDARQIRKKEFNILFLIDFSCLDKETNIENCLF
ncbi:MAG TPA: hypothetical protein VK959_03320 [Methylophilaceae bacterium]|jgi:hypothetical protein|nr:hypothetical protein [Methylophilaceae bacterium]